jgi:hypothetical protein
VKGTDPGMDTASLLGTLASDLPMEKVLEAMANDPLPMLYQHQLPYAKIGNIKEKQ